MKRPKRQRRERKAETERRGPSKGQVTLAGVPATVLVVPMKILAKPEPIKHTRK